MDLSSLSDEQKSLAVAVAVIVIVNVVGFLYDVPFLTLSVLAVTAGLVAVLLTNYALTGSFSPGQPR